MSHSNRGNSDHFVNTTFTDPLARDMFEMMCGKLLGSGVARWTYACWFDSAFVVKIEPGSASFQNVCEWEMWDQFKDLPFGRKWLAPCRHISPCGRILIQERTKPVPPGYKWPKRVPALLTDRKYANFGLIGKRIVAHDYGLMHRTLKDAARVNREEGAAWWGDPPSDKEAWAKQQKARKRA